MRQRMRSTAFSRSTGSELEAAGADYILPAIPDLEELLLE